MSFVVSCHHDHSPGARGDGIPSNGGAVCSQFPAAAEYTLDLAWGLRLRAHFVAALLCTVSISLFGSWWPRTLLSMHIPCRGHICWRGADAAERQATHHAGHSLDTCHWSTLHLSIVFLEVVKTLGEATRFVSQFKGSVPHACAFS